MKVYEGYSSSPDGWNVSSTLELEDDGRFSYSEGWTDYTSASLSGGAGGTWRRDEGGIVFLTERIYDPIYFPWVLGGEVSAVVRDGDLDFGRGWKLSPPPTPTQPPKPPERPRASDAEAAEPSPKPPVTSSKPAVTPTAKPNVARAVGPPSKPPAPSTARAPAAPFEPRAPSPELAALLRRWVDELPTEGWPGNYINRLCKENDAIPLDCTEIYLWALRTDGQVLCIDHESFAQRAEPEENAEIAYGRIAMVAKEHPELWELLPPERRAGGADE
ncbi:MAG TPA: hypothetical protein VJ866_23755 [Pyrinomonadaceae bacterium]|nr:hypothetical protein [Pyrinomonadaceae bacterium]